MVSQTLGYALRAGVCLAMQPEQAKTSHDISKLTLVPAGYLDKLLRALGRQGLVKSQRGLHGGFVLTSDPADLTILDVVKAVDPIRRIRECPLNITSHGTNLCPLHHRLDDALAMIEQAFSKTTLTELINNQDQHIPLCDVSIDR